MTFAQFDLNPLILKALKDCNYAKPTPIQLQSIPDILLGKDLVATAQTGTGKTAAFILPALHKLSLKKKNRKPCVLILTPTRELATQIAKASNMYGKYLPKNIVSLMGGMSYHKQLKGLSGPVDIVIATPGRLLDHMDNGKIDLSSIEILILDEADRMLDMGFVDDIKKIAKKTPNNRQTLLFSATVDSRLKNIINHLLKSPVIINLSNEKVIPSHIKQKLYMANDVKHKMRLLQQLINKESIYKAIVFSATKINADRLATQLTDQGYAALALHGDLKQNVRNRNLDYFRSGKIQFLVATDVAARGINVTDITHVINFDFPKFHEDYVHRIGRTGRAGKSGIAISFALPSDRSQLQRLEKYTNNRFEVCVIAGLEPTEPLDTQVRKSRKKKGFKGRGKPSAKKGFHTPGSKKRKR